VQEGAVEMILVATDRLFASTGDAAEMVRQARVLGQATAQLIQAIKVMVLAAVCLLGDVALGAEVYVPIVRLLADTVEPKPGRSSLQ
jgi:hypothetical protein